MSRKRYGESRNRKQPTWRQETAEPDIPEETPEEIVTELFAEMDDTVEADPFIEFHEPDIQEDEPVAIDDMPVDLQAAAFDYIATGKIADGADPDEVRDVARSILVGTYF